MCDEEKTESVNGKRLPTGTESGFPGRPLANVLLFLGYRSAPCAPDLIIDGKSGGINI
ncbi:MAG: hypothetical protein O7G83_03190 [Proteobacteria bacterium]|nr:hypothetical protein [Pseudomonadota bacterium]